MCTKWHLVRLVRTGVKDFGSLSYFQKRNMARSSRGSPLKYKAVLDNDGNILDDSRLGKLKETMNKNELLMPINQTDISFKKDTKKLNENMKKGNVGTKSKQAINKKDEMIEEDMEDKKIRSQTKEERGFHIPRYTKIYGWDKSNKHLKELGKYLSKNNKNDSDTLVLEGARLINDALSAGHHPTTFIFSRIKLLQQIATENINNSCNFYHVPYSNIEMWSDLTTPTGIMAAFSKTQVVEKAVSCDALPLTLICDNIRSPDNLGAVLRVAAGVGVNKVILTQCCVNPWNRKVLRAAAGAHFLIPIIEKVDWNMMNNHIEDYSQVVLSDIVGQDLQVEISEKERQKRLDELEIELVEEGVLSQEVDEEIDNSSIHQAEESMKKILAKYRQIPMQSTNYSKFSLNSGITDVVVVIGGETEGVSDRAYKFCHDSSGSRLYIPLRNSLNSLNVISATSVVLFAVQNTLLNKISV